VGWPAGTRGLDQKLGFLVGLRGAAQLGWSPVKGSGVEGPLKNLCGRVAAHVSS
jgi:hypothetical protein